MLTRVRGMLLVVCSLWLAACAPRPGDLAYPRRGDEIVVCGQMFHTGAPVVLWTDPGGYDAYRVEKRFGPLERAGWEVAAREGKGPETPNRYNTRFFRFAAEQPNFVGAPGAVLSADEIARIRGGGWDLPLLQRVVDQFVLHYDVCGTSRQCFRILHDVRGLSVHFMLDVDGTIYQTLDLKERGWHATTSNDRSIGIEIANIGAYSDKEMQKGTLERWYGRDERGAYLILPPEMGDGGIRTPGFLASRPRPARTEPVRAEVQGRVMNQYDLTPLQYDSLIKLTAALCRIFPNMPRDYPRDSEGRLVTRALGEAELRAFRGVLGHYHVQDNKSDPGPALQWDAVMGRAPVKRE